MRRRAQRTSNSVYALVAVEDGYIENKSFMKDVGSFIDAVLVLPVSGIIVGTARSAAALAELAELTGVASTVSEDEFRKILEESKTDAPKS